MDLAYELRNKEKFNCHMASACELRNKEKFNCHMASACELRNKENSIATWLQPVD
jgi:hypothetical protein